MKGTHDLENRDLRSAASWVPLAKPGHLPLASVSAAAYRGLGSFLFWTLDAVVTGSLQHLCPTLTLWSSLPYLVAESHPLYTFGS